MSLFPAYGNDSMKDVEESRSGEESAVPAALEVQLMASELSDEDAPRPPRPPPSLPPPPVEPFYLDTKIDYGNMRVSTLYYPGRPEYFAGGARALGGGGGGAPRGAARRRYWQAPPPPPAAAADVAARLAAFRQMLDDDPRDEHLWLRYIEFQEEWGAPGAALAAACEAAARAGSARVRAALHRVRERHLSPDQLRVALRADLAAERRASVRLELWARLLEALGAEGATAGVAAALQHLGDDAVAYPRLLYVHGCVLRAAGLWERLVQLVELVAAMNFPPSSAFPPPPAPAAAAAAAEAAALRREDAAGRSGLPLSVVWARVERLRAAAHWRPAPGAGDADPARAPAPAAAAAALRAARGPGAAAALCVALLRLARVPLLPCGAGAARAAGPEPRAGEAAAPEALAALLRAARRLAPTHAARPASAEAARAALAPLLDPPHYFSDAHGYLRWCSALWEACCAWAAGARRLALVCWRLRWLHALARLADAAEARRLRAAARAALRRHAPAQPEAFAHFARLEAHVAGAAAGRRAALQALRAALRDRPAAPEAALFAARVVRELAEGGAAPAPAPAAAWALCAAALRRPLPPDAALEAPPPRELRDEALQTCVERCTALESEFEAAAKAAAAGAEPEEEGDVCAAMLPGPGEWAAARAALASPAERARLLARLLATRDLYRAGAALQYGEQAACALVQEAAGGARAAAARALLPLFPENALLALVCGGAPLWAGGAAPPVPSPRAALALVLPRLLRAPLAADAEPAEAGRLAAECARLTRRGAGGALLAALRLEAEARAPRPRVRAALLAALDAHPDHKWLYVRGATWCGGEAAALCDALLERGLRLHTLREELPEAPEPSGDAATEPPGDADTEPPGDAATEPPGDADTEPPGDAATEPPGDAATEPPGDAATEPPGDAATEPPGDADTEPPGDTDTEPPGDAATEPPGDAATEPPGDADTEPPGDTASEPPETAAPS